MPASLLNDEGTNLDAHRIWAAMMQNEKPGGHGERSVAVGTIDMAVWDAIAKIESKPLFRLLAERARDGLAVLYSTSEVSECLSIAHRIIVMHKGRISAEFGPDATKEQIMAASGESVAA